jgi:predicted RNase H-like HicB family nuclease
MGGRPYVEEVPGVNTQGATLEEARANLREALALVLAANREISRRDEPEECIREPIALAPTENLEAPSLEDCGLVHHELAERC